jgi:hypothetical protein
MVGKIVGDLQLRAAEFNNVTGPNDLVKPNNRHASSVALKQGDDRWLNLTRAIRTEHRMEGPL